jgi:hypothetical protein
METKKGVQIEIRNFGLRSKTWSVLLLCILAGANFFAVAASRPAMCGAWQNAAYVGYLVLSTSGFVLGVVAEIRKKPSKHDIQQIIIKRLEETESTKR